MPAQLHCSKIAVVIDSAGSNKLKAPDASEIKRLADGAHEDLEAFNKLVEQVHDFDHKLQRMDRVFTYPAVILFAVLILFGLVIVLFYGTSDVFQWWLVSMYVDAPRMLYENKGAAVAMFTLFWLFVILQAGQAFASIRTMKIHAWLWHIRKWIYLGLVLLAYALLMRNHIPEGMLSSG